MLLVSMVGLYIVIFSHKIVAEVEGYSNQIDATNYVYNREKTPPIYIRGLYLTASSAANPKKRAEIIKLINDTELNTVVIDIKDYTGNVLYASKVKNVRDFKTARDVLKNTRDVVADFKKAGIYVIARQTVFQDPVLAAANPAWAIKSSYGGLWRDTKGLSWVDPTKKEVWTYNTQIAEEVIKFGFDEINFDYVRFPSDGDISTAVYSDIGDGKEAVMHSFYSYLHDRLQNKPAYISVDLFGLTTAAHDTDLNIGQTLKAANHEVDYIYPMMYPSHYPDGYLGYANPADHPYEVISDGLTKAQTIMDGSATKLRPWLQAFNLGAVYDGEKIRNEIHAAEQADNVAGWVLWNASNTYSSDGLLAKDVPDPNV